MVVPEIPMGLQHCPRHPLQSQSVDTDGSLYCLGCLADQESSARTCFFCDQTATSPVVGVILESSPERLDPNNWNTEVCNRCHDDMLANRSKELIDRYAPKFTALYGSGNQSRYFNRAAPKAARHVVRAYCTNPAHLVWREITVDESVRIHNRLGVIAQTATKMVLWREDLWQAAVRGHIAFQGSDWDMAGLVGQVWLMQTRQPIFLNNVSYRSLGPTPVRLLGYVLQRIGDTLEPSWLVQYAVYSSISEQIEFRTSRMRPSQHSFQIGEPIPEWFCNMTAAAAFMNMNLVAVERQTPSRNVRRLLEREGNPPVDIGVIVLRRSVSANRSSTEEGKEWDCCWIVASHWRRQWMPSKKTWEPRYIWTYQKGDPTKPLKTPKQDTIYYVKR